MTDLGFPSEPESFEDPDFAADPAQAPDPEPLTDGGAFGEPGEPDPAALIVAWLRHGFEGLHAELQQARAAIDQQETDLIQLVESQSALAQLAETQALLRQAVDAQSSEINVSLAELEGCAAQLRNEAATLHNLRSELSVSFGAMQLELREAMMRELPAMVADVVQPVFGPVVADLSARIDELGRRTQPTADPAAGLRELTGELRERLPALVQDAVRAALAVPQQADGSETERPPSARDALAAPEPVDAASMPEAEESLLVEAEAGADGGGDADAGIALPVAAPEASRRAPEPEPEDEGLLGMVAAPLATVTDVSIDTGVPSVARAEPAEPVAPEPGPFETAPESFGETAPEPSVETAAAPSAVPEPVVETAVETGGRETAEDQPAGTEVTCVMPGLAVGPSLAVAVSAALERSRVRRRRRRRAGPPAAGLHRRDPYASDVGRRLERFALARGDRVFERRDAGALPELRVAAGEYGGHEFAIDLSVLGCLCLLGAQSASVARALAASLLFQPGLAHTEVIAVGDVVPASPAVPGLTRAENAGAALDRLEAEIADRAVHLADDRADTVAVFNARHPDRLVPPLLFVTSRLAESDGQRLRKLVTDVGHCGVAAIVVGEQLDGSPTLHLDSGGIVEALHPETTLGGLVGARLFLLSPDSLTPMLDVLATARTDGDDPWVADDEPFVVVDPPGEVPVQVQLLGSYRIDAAGKEIRSGLRAKARELLAFYLLHPEGTTLDTATEALWPEADPGRGSEWFWTALGNLRSLLRTTTGIKELKVIEREGDIYKAEPIFDVDLWRLEQVLHEASTSGDRAGDGVGGDELWAECLQRAAEIYSGELLADADWAWAKVPRDDLRCRAVDVLVSLSATRLVTGDIRGALDVLQRAVDTDPYSEQLYRRIMRLHGKLSRPDAVAATFRRLQTRLAEIDLEPTGESDKLLKELSAGA